MFAIVATLLIGKLMMLFFYYIQRRKRLKASTLPSPKGLPVVGQLLDFTKDGKRIHLMLDKWAKDHGDIYEFKIFGKSFVIINSVDAIYEALVKKGKDFAGRPPLWRFSYLLGDKKGKMLDISMHNPDSDWAKRRKVAHKSLKIFGEGMTKIEDLSLQYVEILVQKFNDHGSEPFDPKDDIYRVLTGMMYTLILGVFIEDDSQEMMDALDVETNFCLSTNMDAQAVFLDGMPFRRHFRTQKYKYLEDAINKRDEVYGKLLEGTKESVVLDAECDRGMADALYRAQKEQGTETFSDESIYAVLTDMTIGGVATSGTTFHALLYVLAVQKDTQIKAQTEISEVLGDRAFPQLSDKEHLPYCRAIIYEALRYFTTTPLLLPHYTTEDTEIQGHQLKKNTTVIMNAWSAQHDSRYWEDPYCFKPERFIDSDGQLVLSDHPCRKGVLTFGAGHKSCIGEVLALNRLFLFLVSILHHFDIILDPTYSDELDIKNFTMESVIKSTPYKIIAKPRT